MIRGPKKGERDYEKECHGWDYKGKRGAYSKGSRFTGISGIRNMANDPEQEVVRILNYEMERGIFL